MQEARRPPMCALIERQRACLRIRKARFTECDLQSGRLAFKLAAYTATATESSPHKLQASERSMMRLFITACTRASRNNRKKLYGFRCSPAGSQIPLENEVGIYTGDSSIQLLRLHVTFISKHDARVGLASLTLNPESSSDHSTRTFNSDHSVRTFN